MTEQASASVVCFDGFWLDRRGGGLFRADQGGCLLPVALGSRALDLLDYLARHGGEPVSKDKIMTIVWSGRVVEEANLNVQVSKLRQILDQDRPHGSCIQTITGFGYRFAAEVTFLDRLALSRFRPMAERATPAADSLRGAGCLSGLAGQAESGVTANDKVARLVRSERPLRPAENEPHGARTRCGAENRSFLISRLGAAGVIDPDLVAVLVKLHQRLIDDYGGGTAARMLIDQVIAAYQDFIRLTGWITHLSLTVERQLFGGEGAGALRLADPIHPNETCNDEHCVEQHLLQLLECLLPLVERRGASMREMLASLEVLPGKLRGKTTAVFEPMGAELDQSSGRQRVVSAPGEIDDVQARDADFVLASVPLTVSGSCCRPACGVSTD